MHFNTLIAPALIAAVSAYPGFKTEEERAVIDERAGPKISQTNCGFNPCTSFDAKDQFIDVRPGSGHEFISPQSINAIRGPCPGLNSCANHGYLSRSGILTFEDTTFRLNKCLGLSHEFGAILFVFSVFNSGSFIDMKWSIGGPIPGSAIGVIGQGMGISNSHNKYEGDSSPGRGDAYLHNGDAHSLNLGNYANLRKHTANGKSHNMKTMREHVRFSHEYTIHNNPYGFYGPAFFVAPIAHQFVVNFMSNHSAENPGGELKRNVLDSFFSVKEKKDGSLEWIKGHDKIPYNWYRRPSNNPYGVESSFGDLGITCAENPAICDVGGNLGKPNSFVGIEVEDLTSGVFTGEKLLQGNNLACFALQGLVFFTPDAANGIAAKLTPFEKLANKIVLGQLSKLSCPQITEKDYKKEKFNKYPGFQYQPPIQPDQPY